jgi:hypothetical protein
MSSYSPDEIVKMLSDAANLANDIRAVQSTKFSVTQTGGDLYLQITGDRWSANSSMKLPKFLTLDDANAFATSLGTQFSQAVLQAIGAKTAFVKQRLKDISDAL